MENRKELTEQEVISYYSLAYRIEFTKVEEIYKNSSNFDEFERRINIYSILNK